MNRPSFTTATSTAAHATPVMVLTEWSPVAPPPPQAVFVSHGNDRIGISGQLTPLETTPIPETPLAERLVTRQPAARSVSTSVSTVDAFALPDTGDDKLQSDILDQSLDLAAGIPIPPATASTSTGETEELAIFRPVLSDSESDSESDKEAQRSEMAVATGRRSAQETQNPKGKGKGKGKGKTTKRPHPCNLCEKSFALASTLKTHLLTHTKERPHPCNLCEKSFALASTLKRHLLTQHSATEKKASLGEKK